MTRIKIITVLAMVATMLSTGGTSLAADLSGGYTCNELKETVASYGASVVLAAARGRGIPEHNVKRIRY